MDGIWYTIFVECNVQNIVHASQSDIIRIQIRFALFSPYVFVFV